MSKFVEAARKNEIPDQSAKCVEVEDKTIAIFNLGGEFYAIDNTCTHRGGPLDEGDIIWGGSRMPLALCQVQY